MPRRKIRVATVGGGYFSRFHHEAWSRLDEAELVAVCDLDATKAHDLSERWQIPAVYQDAGAMLDEAKPDLLDIITQPAGHLPLIRLAAERKIAVICQKPFCRSLAEATEATQLAAESDTLLVVHENFRFQPWYVEIKRLIEAGAVGDCYQATFRLRPGDGQGPRAYLDRQPYFQTMERFLVRETAVHFVDTFRFLFGEVESVFADLRRLNPVIKGEDAGLVVFRHRNGVRSLFDGNRLLSHAASNPRLTMGEMLVEGSTAVLRLAGDGRLLRRGHGERAEEIIDYRWNQNGFGGDSVMRLQRHVLDHRLGRGPIFNLALDYLANLRIVDAIYLSAATDAAQRLEPA